MLHPTTADADVDDPTIRRCMGFARKWGFGGIIVINLFPFRATDPSELKTASNVHGVAGDVANYTICLDLVTCCPQICVAWGSLTWDVAKDIARAFLRNFVARQIVPVCLGLTADKWPRHPLYVRGDTQPIPYTEFPGGAA
jgi:hypothetical protein